MDFWVGTVDWPQTKLDSQGVNICVVCILAEHSQWLNGIVIIIFVNLCVWLMIKFAIFNHNFNVSIFAFE